MATNIFVGIREAKFRPRPAASYTFRLVMLPEQRLGVNVYTHGALAITGFVQNVSSVAVERRVILEIEPSGQRVAAMWSDPNNPGNNYFFNGLRALEDGERYVLKVVARDGTTAARIKDNRVPV